MLQDHSDASHPSEAADLLAAFLARSPDDREALLALATSLDDEGRAAEARPVWEHLLVVAAADGDRPAVTAAARRLAGFPPPGDSARAQGEPLPAATPKALARLGWEHYRNRRFTEAIAAWRDAIRLQPDYAEGYNNICAAYNELRMWDQAVEACTKAIELRPDMQLARNNLAWAKAQKTEGKH